MLLHDASHLARRRDAARGGLAPLAHSLATDLAPLLDREPFFPTEKARLTRAGGRCPRDGEMLDFDPWSPQVHRCPRCGESFTGDAHYRWWIMGYQLWLAERAVHAALLHALAGDARHARLADSILDGYAGRYLAYPNRDNVLGPTRPFFSTYLESIWLLQLTVALDLRESAGIDPALAAHVRERVVEPSRALIASYDEGDSNRQVWNNAALLAAARLLGDLTGVDRVVHGPSGLAAHLSRALLADGTWYEGENYHLFAHRGLWYGVTMCDVAGVGLAPPLVRRFVEGFATPFVSALPDFTFPSRRDSQYAVSLRQWRFAELAELGLARGDDPRLRAALRTLYTSAGVPRGDTGRARSTAEAERNVPAAALTRADLGWRSLLHAPEALPPLDDAAPPRSALLDAQGLAILRRDEGRVYVALDYGHSGGGHGHPDRLNLLLVDGVTRWLDDVGTGSYVDPTLHWYRSTLAHNAPLVQGRSQARVSGVLRAWDERGGAGWVDADVSGVAPGVRLRRAVVVMPDYLVDELRWSAPDGTVLDLPLHAPGELHGVGPWECALPSGGSAPDDGFPFLTDGAVARGSDQVVRLDAALGPARASAWLLAAAADVEWWRATAPGAPGNEARDFHFARLRGASGSLTTVWSWRSAVASVAGGMDRRTVVHLADGTRHEHGRADGGWHVDLAARGARSSISLGGTRENEEFRDERGAEVRDSGGRSAEPPRAGGPPHQQHHADAAIGQQPIAAPSIVSPLVVMPGHAPSISLGEPHYRRSELPWAEADAPTADVRVGVAGGALVVDVTVHKRGPLVFAPQRDANELDNEHPDINSDGVQLYAMLPPLSGDGAWRYGAWLLVPRLDEPERVRVTPLGGDAQLPFGVTWRAVPGGYAIRCVLADRRVATSSEYPFYLDVVVNEISPDRERRRGQLVLSGGRGEYVYLRGDRHSLDRLLPFLVRNV